MCTGNISLTSYRPRVPLHAPVSPDRNKTLCKMVGCSFCVIDIAVTCSVRDEKK